MTFVDTNVLVYFADGRDAAKQRIARSILAEAMDNAEYWISAQVLNEFANVAIKKLNMPEDEVVEFVTEFQALRQVLTENRWTIRALEIKKRYGIQFYDALVLAAAEANRCDTILTEDLNVGQLYCGIKAINPFK